MVHDFYMTKCTLKNHNIMTYVIKIIYMKPITITANTIHISYSTLQILEDLGAFQCYRRKTLISSRVIHIYIVSKATIIITV